MTRNQFAALCAEQLILPEVALESDAIHDALADGADESQIRDILESEF